MIPAVVAGLTLVAGACTVSSNVRLPWGHGEQPAPSRATPSAPAPRPAGARARAPAQAARPSRWTPDPQAMAAFHRCQADFARARASYENIDAGTTAALEAASHEPLQRALARLMGQYRKNCTDAKKLGERLIHWARYGGSSGRLVLAIAKLQASEPFIPASPITADDVPSRFGVGFTGDRSFDEAMYCYDRTYGRPRWMRPDALRAFLARRAKLMNARMAVVNKVIRALNRDRAHAGIDRGRVKRVRRIRGGLRVTVASLYGGSVCVHTGQWRWVSVGGFWSDCDYPPAKEKEVYRFTARIPTAVVPPTGIRRGDVIQVAGRLTPGPNAGTPTARGTIDATYVIYLRRGRRDIWSMPMLDELDCRM